MEGTVYHINADKARYSLYISGDLFLIFEPIGHCELLRGDIIRTTPERLGEASLYNISTNCQFDAYLENLVSGERAAKRECLL
ncbi:hypothetical protein [Flavobacterium psychrotrophum]|jgi:hypothetical protein|uniref:hypothetical protein n=1 Tax=Flavobacterium psychrotrophum TaxID=2294119 RepID=UPI000E324A3C|nr:hypothetical protein [Flavobacterium psychrotrophum]